jgi:2-dehydro-3-deoxyphosphooctonate aldolase (KDO 8-P synthase)
MIKAVLCDVDGVLTSGQLIYSDQGEATKIFSARDGWGFKKLKDAGYTIGILSGRDSAALRSRLSNLPIDFMALGQDDKGIGYSNFKAEFGFVDAEIAYIGDDELDTPILTQVGLACVPMDAHPVAKACSHEIIPVLGGQGVLRFLSDSLCQKTAPLGLPNISNESPIVAFVGMNVIEEESMVMDVAERIKSLGDSIGLPVVFKASFDKANRSSVHSYRGPGMIEGLRILAKVKNTFQLPILTDIHEPHQAGMVAEVADVIQIPAFLSRQTELLRAAAQTNRPLHIKKMQMMAPKEMRHIVEKCRTLGCKQPAYLCERGTLFGYHNLIVDPLSFDQLKQLGCPVTFDVTHALQLPGAGKSSTLGRSELAPQLIRAGIFIETHPDPTKAKCDGPCATPLGDLSSMLKNVKALDDFVKSKLN